jgi:hypothetical protein
MSKQAKHIVEMGHTVRLKEILYWLVHYRLVKKAIQLSAYSLEKMVSSQVGYDTCISPYLREPC